MFSDQLCLGLMPFNFQINAKTGYYVCFVRLLCLLLSVSLFALLDFLLCWFWSSGFIMLDFLTIIFFYLQIKKRKQSNKQTIQKTKQTNKANEYQPFFFFIIIFFYLQIISSGFRISWKVGILFALSVCVVCSIVCLIEPAALFIFF